LREIDETRMIFGAGVCDDFDSNPGDGFVFPDPIFTGHVIYQGHRKLSTSVRGLKLCQ